LKKTQALKASVGGSNIFLVVAQPFSNQAGEYASRTWNSVQPEDSRSIITSLGSASSAPHILSIRKEMLPIVVAQIPAD